MSYEHPAPVSQHFANRHENCFNCGLPTDRVSGKGRILVLSLKPGNRFCRQTKRTVWVCSDDCAFQTLAISKYGTATHKWPVTLAQFKATNPLPLSEDCHRPETIAERRINSGSSEPENKLLDQPYLDLVSGRKSGRKTRIGGRPRKWKSDAERKRAYRRKRHEPQTSETCRRDPCESR